MKKTAIESIKNDPEALAKALAASDPTAPQSPDELEQALSSAYTQPTQDNREESNFVINIKGRSKYPDEILRKILEYSGSGIYEVLLTKI